MLLLVACASQPSEPHPGTVETAPNLSEAPAAETEDGVPERTAILEIARAEVRRSGLDGDVAFSDPWGRQSGEWAFVRAAFRRPDGREIFETDPDYCEADAVVELLLRRDGSGWEVVSGERDGSPYCVSDVAGYDRYEREFGAPISLFPADYSVTR